MNERQGPDYCHPDESLLLARQKDEEPPLNAAVNLRFSDSLPRF